MDISVPFWKRHTLELDNSSIESCKIWVTKFAGDSFRNKLQIRNLYPGHEEESIERLKIVNSMKEKIQQAFGVWLVCFSLNTFKKNS